MLDVILAAAFLIAYRRQERDMEGQDQGEEWEDWEPWDDDPDNK